MEQGSYRWWRRGRTGATRHLPTPAANSAAAYGGHSGEEQRFAEGSAGRAGGCVWPPGCYSCSFCGKKFPSAQALGGHMNVHRRDRARLRLPSPPGGHLHDLNPRRQPQLPAPSAAAATSRCPLVCSNNNIPNTLAQLGAAARHPSPSRFPAVPAAGENSTDRGRALFSITRLTSDSSSPHAVAVPELPPGTDDCRNPNATEYEKERGACYCCEEEVAMIGSKRQRIDITIPLLVRRAGSSPEEGSPSRCEVLQLGSTLIEESDLELRL